MTTPRNSAIINRKSAAASSQLIGHLISTDRLVPAERSACFYGKCHSQDDHEHQKFQKKFSHSSPSPLPKHFCKDELTAIFVTTLLPGPFSGPFYVSIFCRNLQWLVQAATQAQTPSQLRRDLLPEVCAHGQDRLVKGEVIRVQRWSRAAAQEEKQGGRCRWCQGEVLGDHHGLV